MDDKERSAWLKRLEKIYHDRGKTPPEICLDCGVPLMTTHFGWGVVAVAWARSEYIGGPVLGFVCNECHFAHCKEEDHITIGSSGEYQDHVNRAPTDNKLRQGGEGDG